MPQPFCNHCVEYIELDTCAKCHKHRSSSNKVMTVQKGPCQIGLITVENKNLTEISSELQLNSSRDFCHKFLQTSVQC